jgi:hypothetical protein
VKSDGEPNKRSQRTRHERASLLSYVGEPLKRVYKASQEKKERTHPRGAGMVFVFEPDSTQ